MRQRCIVGALLGHQPTRKTARFHEMEAPRVHRGRIVEMWSVVDRSDVFVNLDCRSPNDLKWPGSCCQAADGFDLARFQTVLSWRGVAEPGVAVDLF